jgi:hypothetical protein
MWAYRLPPADDHGLLLPYLKVVKGMVDRGDTTPEEFSEDIKLVKQMARALGWDGTRDGPIKGFLVPAPSSFMVGYVLTQASSSQRYVVSPVPLDYMVEHLDWDARTSTEEVQRATSALHEDKIETHPPIVATEWNRSRKGNYYAHINGALVTIIPAREGEGKGFKAFVSSPNKQHKAFTRTFANELECAQYVIDKFYDIIREWGATGTAANPFDGVDFSAGEEVPF